MPLTSFLPGLRLQEGLCSSSAGSLWPVGGAMCGPLSSSPQRRRWDGSPVPTGVATHVCVAFLFLSPLPLGLPLQGHLLDEMNGLPTRSPPIPLLGQRARLREARASPSVSRKGDWMLKQLVCSGPELQINTDRIQVRRWEALPSLDASVIEF